MSLIPELERIIRREETVLTLSLTLRFLEAGSPYLDWGRVKSQWLAILLFWPSGWTPVSDSVPLLIMPDSSSILYLPSSHSLRSPQFSHFLDQITNTLIFPTLFSPQQSLYTDNGLLLLFCSVFPLELGASSKTEDAKFVFLGLGYLFEYYIFLFHPFTCNVLILFSFNNEQYSKTYTFFKKKN